MGFFRLAGHLPGKLFGSLGLDILLAGTMWFVFWTLGEHAARILRLRGFGRGERMLVACGLGAGICSTALLLLGLAGLWDPFFLRGLFLAGAGLGAYRLYAGWPGDRVEAEYVPPLEGLGPLQGLALLLMAFAAVMNLMATAAPEIFYDSLVYHLSLPRLYLLRGRIMPTPENLFSGFPFGVQMLYGWALALSDEGLAALLHSSFGMATAAGLFAWGRRWAGASTGVLAALFFYLAPIGIYASWHCGIDLGSSFYVILAFTAITRSLQKDDGREAGARPPLPVLAGLFVGFAMSTKYNVLPLGTVLIALHALLSRRCGRPLKDSVWMASAAALVLAPWLLKNILFYGNPLYPFLHQVIGWAAPADWEPVLRAGGGRNLAEVFGTWAGFKEFLTHPWNYSTGSWPLGDWLGPAYILLLPWALMLRWGLFRRDETPKTWTTAAALALGGYLVWCLVTRLVRFLLPALPLLACAGALAVQKGAFPRWLNRAAWAGALLACMFGFQACFRQGLGIGQWDMLEGRISREAYLKHQRVTYGLPYFAAMEFVNSKLPRDAKVLFLGESRAYYCERDFIAATIYDHNPFWGAVRASSSAADLAARVREMGVTHIFLSARQLHFRSDSPPVMPRDLVLGKVYPEFWARYTDKLFEEREDGGRNPRWLLVMSVRSDPKMDPKDFTPDPARFVVEVLKRQGR